MIAASPAPSAASATSSRAPLGSSVHAHANARLPRPHGAAVALDTGELVRAVRGDDRGASVERDRHGVDELGPRQVGGWPGDVKRRDQEVAAPQRRREIGAQRVRYAGLEVVRGDDDAERPERDGRGSDRTARRLDTDGGQRPDGGHAAVGPAVVGVVVGDPRDGDPGRAQLAERAGRMDQPDRRPDRAIVAGTGAVTDRPLEIDNPGRAANDRRNARERTVATRPEKHIAADPQPRGSRTARPIGAIAGRRATGTGDRHRDRRRSHPPAQRCPRRIRDQRHGDRTQDDRSWRRAHTEPIPVQ
jgi:hypothetical protein